MSEVWWNLDQAVAWVMTRNKDVVSHLKNGGLTALILYPMDFPTYFQETKGWSKEAIDEHNKKRIDFWEKFARGNSKDLLAALESGAVTAMGIENGTGSHAIKIEPDWWPDLDINSTSRPSIAISKNGAFWEDVRLQAHQLKKHFPEKPLPSLQPPDKQELENITNSLTEECKKTGKKLNRETLRSEINARLSKGKVSSAWAREKIKDLPLDIKNPKNRPSKIYIK